MQRPKIIFISYTVSAMWHSIFPYLSTTRCAEEYSQMSLFHEVHRFVSNAGCSNTLFRSLVDTLLHKFEHSKKRFDGIVLWTLVPSSPLKKISFEILRLNSGDNNDPIRIGLQLEQHVRSRRKANRWKGNLSISQVICCLFRSVEKWLSYSSPKFEVC